VSAELLPGTIAAIRATPEVLRALIQGQPEVVTAARGAESWSPSHVTHTSWWRGDWAPSSGRAAR